MIKFFLSNILLTGSSLLASAAGRETSKGIVDDETKLYLSINPGGTVRKHQSSGSTRKEVQSWKNDLPRSEADWAFAISVAHSLGSNLSLQASKSTSIGGRRRQQMHGIDPQNHYIDEGEIARSKRVKGRSDSLGSEKLQGKLHDMNAEDTKSISEEVHALAHQIDQKQMPKSDRPAGQVQSQSKVSENQMPGAEGAVVVVQSWVLFHVMRDYATLFAGPLDKGSVAVQNALADALDLCRPAVRVTDARAFDIGNFERVLMQFGTRGTLQRREAPAPPLRYAEVFKLIEVRLSFVIPVFPTMGYNASQVNDRIEHLQSFASFADLDLLLASALRDIGAGSGAGLDDIGEGEIHHATDNAPYTRITADEVADCLAEDELRLARHHHHIVMVLCFALLALITCAGVALFTAQRSVVVRNRLHALPGSSIFNRDQ